MEVAGDSLRASLLARRAEVVDNEDEDDGDGRYVVNLDPRVVELLHEARHLQLMNLTVHDAAQALCQQQARITDTRDACVISSTDRYCVYCVQ